MTTAEPVLADKTDVADPAQQDRWSRIEWLLDRASERLNPILVKEARQALKSRQFLVTFSLLLFCGWAWSLLGITIMSPKVYYEPGGIPMLIGYYFVLAVPLLVVVPFAAFRSLASEREDGTFELLSISTLTGRQIVSGKLGSSILQMMVYYSALSPCIAFTYLLRGVDVITLLLLLGYTFLVSVILSVVSLLVATVTQSRSWQVVLSVLLLVGLLAAGLFWSVFIVNMLLYMQALDDPNFWIGNLAGVMFYVSFLVLFHLTAAAQISFASDNRSTRLRWVMVGQQTLLVGWMTYLWLRVTEEGVLYVAAVLGGIYWMTMGSLLSGELARLSPRVKRGLPQSFLGRMFRTWTNPGSGTGYVFAVVNLAGYIAVLILAGWVANLAAFAGQPDASFYLFATVIACYVAIYLGISRFIVLIVRRWFAAGVLVSLLVNIFLLVMGAALPFFAQLWLTDFVEPDYSPLQFVNWLWTIIEVGDARFWAFPEVTVVVATAAVVIFLANLLLAVHELEQTRVATPHRVVEDDQQIRGLDQIPKPASPFE